MFPWASVTGTRYTSVVRVSAQQCWISFLTVTHCRELQLHFFKWFSDECTWFICRNSWDLHTLWFWVLKQMIKEKRKFKSFEASILLMFLSLFFSKCFSMLHVFQKIESASISLTMYALQRISKFGLLNAGIV